jgi:DNA-binding PadR family transcriptional regulator
MADPTELLHGTLDTLILKTLAWGPRHGYAIARWLEGMGAEVLKIEERRGWIDAEWGLSETKRRVKLYRLTAAGRERLAVETAQWSRFADAVGRILDAPVEPA